MSGERVYIIYDSDIEQDLGDQLQYIKDNPPDGFDVDYPSRTGKSQGEIWRGIVKPEPRCVRDSEKNWTSCASVNKSQALCELR